MKIRSRVTTESYIQDFPQVIELLRLPDFMSLTLSWEGREVTFERDEWHRLLDLALEGYKAESSK